MQNTLKCLSFVLVACLLGFFAGAGNQPANGQGTAIEVIDNTMCVPIGCNQLSFDTQDPTCGKCDLTDYTWPAVFCSTPAARKCFRWYDVFDHCKGKCTADPSTPCEGAWKSCQFVNQNP
jgi:hypothetical protein